MKLFLGFLLLSSIAFGQSKKKKIESLNKSLDSLNYVIDSERKLHKDKIEKAKQNINEANKKYSDPRTSPKVKADLKPKLDVIKKMFPQKLSEAEPNKS